MDEDAIRRTLEAVFREIFEDDTLVISDSLSSETVQQWNSLGHIRLVSEMEEVFSVTFTLEEIESMTSAARVLAVLRAKSRN